MNKIKLVALNSGGLDSVVLMHHLNEKFPDTEVHTLFFDYGQKALKFEEKCSKDVSEKLGFKWTKITIEPFNWSNSTLIKGDTAETYDSLYLEMRNMIFVSYATSYAQSVGAVKVYSAIIEPPEENAFCDATPDFVECISKVMNLGSIDFCTPFIGYDKQTIFSLARQYSITLDSFCSCFHTEKTPKDMCSNCELISENTGEYFSINNGLEDTFNRGGDAKQILEARKLGEITTAKLSINNSCNLRCPYCLMTGVNHTDTPKNNLVKDNIKKLYGFGIRNFDIFGKEPLYNDEALNILQSFGGYSDINFSMITNGKNLDKYSEALLQCKNLSSLTVSYDGGAYREFTVEDSTLSYLISQGLNISISIDLHNKNWFELNRYLSKFFDLGVESVYIKPIEDWGGCDKTYSIGENLYESVISEVVSQEFSIPETIFSIPYKYKRLTKKYNDLFKFDIPKYSDRSVSFDLDAVCTAGHTSIFVNYDGKVYGCGISAYERPNTGTPLNLIKSYAELKDTVCNYSGRNCCNPIDFNNK